MMRLLGLLLACASARGFFTQTCLDVAPTLPAPDALPLCGNGVIDHGEVCDDGNQIGGDGCNAWCSGFDRLTSACTLAGSSTPCANRYPVLGLPSQSAFCSLTAIAGRGKSLFLADGGVLIQYDMLDAPTPLRAFASTPVMDTLYKRFCGIAPLPPPSTGVVAHECVSQRLILFPNPTSADGVRSIAELNLTPSSGTPFHDVDAGVMVVAGAPLTQPLPTIPSVAILVSVSLPSGDTLSTLATVPTTIDVKNNLLIDNVFSWSFDASGMVVTQVHREQCADVPGDCYVIYMQRPDMHRLLVYVPLDQRSSVYYHVSTDTMRNAVPPTMSRTGAFAKYTLDGSCLTSTPLSGKAPTATMGDTCSLVPYNGWNCSTPLRNPFATEVLFPSFLLPGGLSSGLRHWQLAEIFGAGNMASINSTSSAGASLYSQLLHDTLHGTAPVDMTEIRATGDIAYITSNAVQLVSTKGVQLQDYSHYPYCLASTAILCPTGTFGTVGGVCTPCPSTTGTMSLTPSDAEQMQCVPTTRSGRRILSNMQVPPTTKFSVRSDEVDIHDELTAAMCYFNTVMGRTCTTAPSQVDMSAPTNEVADDSSSSQSPNGAVGTLLRSITSDPASPIHPTAVSRPEHVHAYVVQDTSFFDALINRGTTVPIAFENQTEALQALGIKASDYAEAASKCVYHTSRGIFRKFLECVMRETRKKVGETGGAPNRRLRSDSSATPNTEVKVSENTGGTYVANGPIDWPNTPATPPGNSTTPVPNSSSSDTNVTAIAIAAGVIIVIALIFFTKNYFQMGLR